MSTYWGYHLMLDCSGCNENIKEKNQIYNFVKELVEEIDMVAHGEPIIEHLLSDQDNAGYSLMQLITTSNICGHFVDKDNSAYLDVFSCKQFETETVINIVKKYFNPNKVRINYITRNAD